MKGGAALLPAFMLAAALCGCGAPDDPPARPEGEARALERAEAMLGERPATPQPADSPQP
jgi:hypothetical protein